MRSTRLNPVDVPVLPQPHGVTPAVKALGIGVVNKSDLTMVISQAVKSADNIPGRDMDFMKPVLRDVYDTPEQNSPCHPTAAELRSILGQGQDTKVGGAGPEHRREAIQHCKDLLADGGDHVISLKGTAGDDGHSFTLVAQGGKVDVLEAWAAGAHSNPGDLHSLAPDLKTGLTLKKVETALDRIANEDPDVRTKGYKALSIAYPGSLGFEKAHGGVVRDDPANISLVAHSRPLKPTAEITQAMQERLSVLEDWKKVVLPTDDSTRTAAAAGLDSNDEGRRTRTRHS